MLAEAGDDVLVKEILAVFQTDSTERLAAMRAACSGDDRTALRRQAHALKGSSGQVGALRLSKICQALEAKAPAGPREELEEILAEAERAFAEVRQAMSAE